MGLTLGANYHSNHAIMGAGLAIQGTAILYQERFHQPSKFKPLMIGLAIAAYLTAAVGVVAHYSNYTPSERTPATFQTTPATPSNSTPYQNHRGEGQ